MFAYTSAEDKAIAALDGFSRLSINRLNGPSQFPQPYVLAPTADTHTHTIIALHGRGSNGPEVRSSSTSASAFHSLPTESPKTRTPDSKMIGHFHSYCAPAHFCPLLPGCP